MLLLKYSFRFPSASLKGQWFETESEDKPAKLTALEQAAVDKALADKRKSTGDPNVALDESEKYNAMIGAKHGDTAAYMIQSPDTNVSGMDALQNYKPDVQTMARKLLKAEIPYPSNFAIKDPFWKAVITAASDAEPGFNAAQYNVRLS